MVMRPVPHPSSRTGPFWPRQDCARTQRRGARPSVRSPSRRTAHTRPILQRRRWLTLRSRRAAHCSARWPTVAKSMVFWISTKDVPAFCSRRSVAIHQLQIVLAEPADRFARGAIDGIADRLAAILPDSLREGRRVARAKPETDERSAARCPTARRVSAAADRCLDRRPHLAPPQSSRTAVPAASRASMPSVVEL